MIAQVTIDDEGAVTVLVDTNEDDDDATRSLASLVLQDLLEHAAVTAISTWTRIRVNANADETTDEPAK